MDDRISSATTTTTTTATETGGRQWSSQRHTVTSPTASSTDVTAAQLRQPGNGSG